MGTHSPFGEESHTTAHTAKRGPSLPRPQHGLVPSAKFLLVLHAFIYIHFPVHCEPSTPAEEKNLSKLPPQTLSQTIFHRVFQLLPQTAHVCFHSRKRVHTRLRQQDRTQRHTRRNRGRFGRGRYYYPRSVPHVSETLRGRGLKRQTLPLLGLGRGRSRRTQRACGTAMRLCASLSRRRRGPAGLRDLFSFLSKLRLVRPALRAFPCVRGEGWYHYPRCALRVLETLDDRLSKGLICRFL